MRLHEQVIELKKILAHNTEVIDELRSYLNSSKFSEDISVNKNDIFLRLEDYIKGEL